MELLASPFAVDLVAGFAVPIPIQVICEFLGVPHADRDLLHGWSEVLVSGWQRDREEVARAFDDLGAYFGELVAHKRRHPAADLLTELVNVYDNSDRLTTFELIRLATALVIVGHETCANQISMFTLALLRHPRQLDGLRTHLDLLPAAVEELLRFVPISGGAGALIRVATQDVELDGTTIGAGEAVIPAVSAANRDPHLFAQPDVLDLGRHGPSHFTFSAGFHACVGASLARIELQEALLALLTRIPETLHLAVPESELRCKPQLTLRSLEALPLAW
ncbi:MAG TPA: cytochrome P450 [Pseudonocardiaceae bacterium]|nr:cytochrome P450 [Pseudonocardiaceae bacterium]